MDEKDKVVLSWSGGKDSALALYELQRAGRYEVVSLFTTLAQEYDRISHHGVRSELLERQAVALGIPLEKLYISVGSSHPCRIDGNVVMAEYEQLMDRAMLRFKAKGITTVAFGDIYLLHLRTYREEKLAQRGMKALFPLWHRDTTELVQSFVALGFKAVLACVDGSKLGEKFAGRSLDQRFIDDLPAGVDPCGENGEYHSFVYDGPLFREPVQVQVGAVVLRDSRYFADLLEGIVPTGMPAHQPADTPIGA
jgi:uncharacterized protein (TIGR00290 family)